MILIVLLIVPILFWLIPFAQIKQREENNMRSFVINFSAMLITSTVIGTILWALSMNWMTIIIVLFAISASWAVLFHLISR